MTSPKSSLSLEVLERIDRACAGFESAWRAGEEPDLMAFLAQVPEADQEHLLAELVQTDRDYRRARGLPVTVDSYLTRLPEYRDAVLRLLESMEAVEQTTDPESGRVVARAEQVPRVPGYNILRELGRGGMGVVYLARHHRLKRLVALKVILAGAHAGTAHRERFRAEAEAVARLQHPNIVQVHEVGEYEGHPYCALEFCSGGTLDRRLAGAPQPPAEAAHTAEVLARAIEAAHRQFVVHRDLKPANILLTADGELKVTDFGLAKRLDEQAQTQTGAIVGSPSYMAPEQAGGKSRDVGPAADIYSLGVILYEMLTGRPPFKSASVPETLRQVVEHEPPPPRELNPAVPRDLETICLKCLRKEPEKRYGSAAELADELVRYQKGEPILARPVGRVERAGKWARRNPAVAGAAAAVVLALTLGTTVSYLKYLEAEAARFAEADRVTERDEALRKEGERVKERDRANSELAYRLGISDFLLAVAAYDGGDMKLAADRLDRVPPGQRGWEWAYLRRQTRGGLFTLRGHRDMVWGVSFSPDGSRLATCSFDGTARVWDARTGVPLLELKGHRDMLSGVNYAPDGARIATCSSDGTGRVWDAHSGAPLLEFKGHRGMVNAVSFSPDGARVATGGIDKTVKVWDARTGEVLLDLQGHTGQVMSLAFSPDGARIASGSSDRTQRIWDARTGSLQREIKGHLGNVQSLAFSPDGARVVTSGLDVTPRVWDARTGQELLQLRGHMAQILSVCFSPDGTRIATAGAEKTVKMWDARTGLELHELKGHTGTIMSVGFSPDGSRIASGSQDRTAKVWDARTGTPVIELKGYAGHVSGMSFSPDGARVASASQDKTAKVWDARTGEQLLELRGHPAQVMGVSFSPDGALIATVCSDGTAKVWEANTGTPLSELKGHTAAIYGVAFSPDGARVATGSHDGTAKVWDARTGQEVFTLKGHTHYVVDVSFSSDGSRIVTGSTDKTSRVWDARTGTPLLELKGHTGAVMGVNFSPDGARIVTGGVDKMGRVWDATTGRELLELKGHTGVVWGVTFSPDGKRIATGSSDRTAKVWDARTGMPLLDLKGHTSLVLGVRFSPDGERIATAGGDQMVKVWDARIGRELRGEPEPLIPDAEELDYRINHARPNYWHYAECYEAAREAGDGFAARFYLDRILALPQHRRTARLRERNALQTGPLVVARTGFHTPELAAEPYDRGTITLLAVQGDRLAKRLTAQELLRDGRPGPAVPLLVWCMAARPAAGPPVEELLLAGAYLDLGQPGEAERFYRAAVEWLDGPCQPIRAANVVALGALNPWAGLGAAVAPVADPRRSPFDWEAWYECDVFRAAVERRLASRP